MDDLERRLRDLGEGVDNSLGDAPIVPRPEVPRRARTRRSGVLVGTALLTVGVVVAGFAGVSAMVGRSYPTADPIILSAAAQATELQETAHTRFEMTMEFGFGSRTFGGTTAGEGEIDFTMNRSHFLADVVAEGVSQTIEVVQDDLIMYTKGAPGTDGWVKTENPASGGFGNQDIRPGEYLDYLNDVSGQVEILGQEVLDGESVTKYRAEIDPELASADMSEEVTEMFDSFEFEYEPFEVWIDGRGLVRQMSFGVTTNGETAGQTFSSTIFFSTSFYDFGVPVEIDLPEESEITEGDPMDPSSSSQPNASPDSFSEFDGFILWGEDGLDGPYAAIGLEKRNFCVFDLPDWVSTAELIDERLDQAIALIDRSDLEETSTGLIGCTFEDVPEALEELESNPESLTLLLIGESQSEEVEITEAFRP